METLKQTLEIILGDKQLSYYLAGFFFSGLAILLSLYHHSRKRDVESPNTPKKFSWTFLVWDNLKRIFITLIVMFILFRQLDLSDVWYQIGVGFLVSLCLDKVIEFLMKKSELVSKLMGMDREKFKIPD